MRPGIAAMTVVVVGLMGAPAAATSGSGGSPDGEAASEAELRERLRTLEAKYKRTGEPKYMYRRVLTLEKMGEYAFALEVLQEHRGEFESSSKVDGVAVVEQRLREKSGRSKNATGGTQSSSGRGSVFSWGLIAGGGASLAGGMVPLLIAESRAKRLRCSPVSAGPNADGCGGVDEYRGLSRSEFDRKSSSVTTLRVVGFSLAGLGVGAATWGLIRMLSGGSAGATAAGPESGVRPRAFLSVCPDGASIRVRLKF